MSACVLGSGALLHSLIPHGLNGEYLLLIHPVVLGSGLRLFPDGLHESLTLIDRVTTTTGVLVAAYRPKSESRDAPEPGP